MSSTTEQEVHPDGSSTTTGTGTGGSESAWESAGAGGTNNTTGGEGTDETFFEGPPSEEDDVVKPTDPAIYLGLGVVVALVLLMVYQIYQNRKKKQYSELQFFTEMDGDKFDLKLPDAVDEYYQVKQKCIDQGWQPGKPPANAQEAQSGPHRTMAQALMKRCIADIPLVQHIQKESTGMNKLYSQSMCSVKQWRMYQAAETMVSQEVEEVRAEADEIEPGWSNMIWRQAMQYHGMLKQKHEAEARAMAAQQAAERKRATEQAQIAAAVDQAKKGAANTKKNTTQTKKKSSTPAVPLTPEQQAAAAEKAAQELLQQEEKEKKAGGKKGGGGGTGGMKKGFLDNKKKGK